LTSIRELVAAAVGLQTERGDQLIVESLPFEATRNWQPLEEPPAPSPVDGLPLPEWLAPYLKDQNKLVLIGAGAAAGLLLFLAVGFVVLRKMKRKKASVEMDGDAALPPGAEAGLAALEAGSGVEAQLQEKLSEQAAMKARLEQEALQSLKLPAVKTKKTEALTKHLAEEAEKEPEAMAQLVRTWLNEEAD
jgi:flagellar biosynthesis/type III secretory pathway M-ring protein FliF/YscJ